MRESPKRGMCYKPVVRISPREYGTLNTASSLLLRFTRFWMPILYHAKKRPCLNRCTRPNVSDYPNLGFERMDPWKRWKKGKKGGSNTSSFPDLPVSTESSQGIFFSIRQYRVYIWGSVLELKSQIQAPKMHVETTLLDHQFSSFLSISCMIHIDQNWCVLV